MGYPMDYKRFVNRNILTGGYDDQPNNLIRGDLRRLESDQIDTHHLNCYAEACGVTVDQAKAVLEMFFSGNVRSNAPKELERLYDEIKHENTISHAHSKL
jgi:hypothetical protein